MDALDVSRWQFGITTVYHFILVPLTIGLAPMVAAMQTMWVITGKDSWYRLTKFFGKLFLINFALGVATGIVQEFQFGMNWSEYSRFVGDVFGAPLALEGLVAFFLESTFLGLWIFGWSRLPKLVHLATIWLVAIGVNASAFFIIAANSWMQHPVGAIYNEETGRAELTDIWALLTNNTALAAFPHAVAGAFLTAATFVAGISGWWMVREARKKKLDEPATDSRSMFRSAARMSFIVMIVAGGALAITGDIQGKLMFEQQPMKMASAESLCDTETGASFSLLTVGTHNNCESVVHLIAIPGLTSFLAENDFGATVQGVNQLQDQYEQQFGPGNYKPNLFVTYWAFRMMIGLAAGSALLAVAGLWVTRGGRIPDQKWFSWLSLLAIPTPFLANSAGWIFTEMGRQPWVVAPNLSGVDQIRLTVDQGVSDHPVGLVVASLVTFTLLYAALGGVWFYLLRRYVIEGPLDHDAHPHVDPPESEDDEPKQLSFAY
ncbi:cytochrome ubiquinol oxidase subunit I [Rhodococcus fascians]|uniref:cytochrome ubiquinol oxidase subunit I n=1 Tax=Nocardiaceae TaxID=85025 RepID=UPI0004816061|nr:MULTISPECIES: cytochrome ubiquinol oxidase subunit I [Rhodococcus]OZD53338.1 cytochrome ubiquinol oxidase subunit I [Rhodococcus sp. 06-1477-1B]KJV00633.1 cytochrome bd ubiquinol oxidase subunit I [Rhodococcus sp. PML026]MBJ7323085.1 cytochrome ubiquinol oxidase subunit I [Rhodococcus sp. (in: high G+C Gram-positive bacteria)]MBX5334030.1 cytochrome ubiquinol oxidase subunit I [Rhodococcus fascians]MBY3793455.1 cytochrome ubiquinol oxidase subunit I [Rhodococcus fascians]